MARKKRRPKGDELRDMYASSAPPEKRSDGTAFSEKTKSKERDQSKVDIHFNRGTEDKGQHGHVTESRDEAGDRTYHYVRDNEGTEYIDDSKTRRD
jgi:hypothetical protein